MVIEVLNIARTMELHGIHQVDEHIRTLGDTFLAKIAATPSSTGLTPKGFAVGTGGGA